MKGFLLWDWRGGVEGGGEGDGASHPLGVYNDNDELQHLYATNNKSKLHLYET